MTDQTRFSDPLDEANALAESLNESGIAAARRACAPESHPNFDGLHCVDCEEDIPPQRLAMKRVRCTACQSRLETHGN